MTEPWAVFSLWCCGLRLADLLSTESMQIEPWSLNGPWLEKQVPGIWRDSLFWAVVPTGALIWGKQTTGSLPNPFAGK